MLFNSLQYLVFLPAVLVLYWIAPRKLRATLLLIASYIFYMSWKPEYGLLIIGLTLGNFFLVPLIATARTPKAKKLRLSLVVAANLIVLGVFKYAQFSLDVAHDVTKLLHISWREPTLSIILPLGISFFVFEFIHYAVEVYRGKPTVKSVIDLSLFAAFFPTQIAGPIKRYTDFVPQLKVLERFSWQNVDDGIWLILLGLFKKLIIADNLAIVVQAGYANVSDFSGLDLWLITYAFAFQIFYDFAGYTDIARGSALLFGFKVPINFNLPYLAANVSDFWHRWHISLSTWLRDYLYIPLGGSRGGRVLNYRNLMLTMALGGLWHGAAMHFLIWGAYQGLLLIAHREYSRILNAIKISRTLLSSDIYHVVSVILTFHLVCVGWVLFRADDMRSATKILRRLVVDAPKEIFNFDWSHLYTLQIREPLVFPMLSVIILALLLAQPLVAWASTKNSYKNPPLLVRVACMTALVCLLLAFSTNSSPNFIYFQF